VQFRGKFLCDGLVILHHATVEIERSVENGVEDWSGSFTGTGKKFTGKGSYQLVLANGRAADIRLKPDSSNSMEAKKICFSIAGGFR